MIFIGLPRYLSASCRDFSKYLQRSPVHSWSIPDEQDLVSLQNIPAIAPTNETHAPHNSMGGGVVHVVDEGICRRKVLILKGNHELIVDSILNAETEAPPIFHYLIVYLLKPLSNL